MFNQDKYMNEKVFNLLKIQKEANDSLINVMQVRIELLEKEVEYLQIKKSAVYDFFEENRHLIPDYVKKVYKAFEDEHEDISGAREMVAMFHDEIFDLSKVECTSNHFKPWP